MFAWDSKKAEQNRNKHGVSFEEAVTAFLDSDGLDGEDVKHSSYERRSFRPLSAWQNPNDYLYGEAFGR